MNHLFSNYLTSNYIAKSIRILGLSLLITIDLMQAQNKSIILGRPTDSSITASILFDQNVEFYFEYGIETGNYQNQTLMMANSANIPDVLDLHELLPDTKYFYRLKYRLKGSNVFDVSDEYFFHTQRSPGSGFRFLIEADEHLYDKKGVRSMYKTTLLNQAKDSADFLLSLGDIFGDDHTPDQTTSADMEALHKDYLQYLGAVCHSMPFFVCLGNHEGENGYYLKQTPPNNIAVYGTKWRKYYYPNPYPNGFYTGNTSMEPYDIGQPENYYAWTWGDALFVVLDVYRGCDINEKPQNWDWTLGENQYNWLKQSLETSKAKYKFVFAHHTRGQGRGAIKTATGYEWGGYSGKGVWEFDKYRPGWAMPIHQLMVASGVNVFFQGHDHLFAKEELDGMVYQEVPMPADSTYEIGVLANADAYTDVTMDGTGHIRVSVTPNCVTVDYIRSYLPADTINGVHHNGEIAYSYTIGKCDNTTATRQANEENLFAIYPNPVKDKLIIKFNHAILSSVNIELINLQGQIIQSQKEEKGQLISMMDVQNIPSGAYTIRFIDEMHTMHYKMIIIQ
jgi:hypothetical protein